MTVLRLSDRTWWKLIAFFSFALLLIPQWPLFVPVSYWFKVYPHSLVIADTVAGSSPTLSIRREIRRPFRAEWIVTVMQMRADGRTFSTFCTVSGENDYRPEARLPDRLDLDWWTFPMRCQLPVGRYQVKTLWTVLVDGRFAREVRVRSNVFRVKRADD